MTKNKEARQYIVAELQSWIDYVTESREKEGLDTPDDTNIMSPPYWPSVGQLKNWIEAIAND